MLEDKRAESSPRSSLSPDENPASPAPGSSTAQGVQKRGDRLLTACLPRRPLSPLKMRRLPPHKCACRMWTPPELTLLSPCAWNAEKTSTRSCQEKRIDGPLCLCSVKVSSSFFSPPGFCTQAPQAEPADVTIAWPLSGCTTKLTQAAENEQPDSSEFKEDPVPRYTPGEAAYSEATGEPLCPPHTTERKLMMKIDLHVLPYLCILYLLAFLDR